VARRRPRAERRAQRRGARSRRCADDARSNPARRSLQLTPIAEQLDDLADVARALVAWWAVSLSARADYLRRQTAVPMLYG